MLRAVLIGFVTFWLLGFVIVAFGGNVGPVEVLLMLVIAVAVAVVVHWRRRA